MGRKHLVTLLKLVLVAGLMAFVFANVQWSDTLITRPRSGDEIVRTGKIHGEWDVPQVRFQVLDDDGEPVGDEQLVTTGDQPDGSNIVVSPGFGTYLTRLDWLLFAAGALCYFATVLFAGTRWWSLLRWNSLRVSWWEAMRFTWIGLFFNNIVPGQTGGDAVKALYILKHCSGGRMPALISVLVDRVLGLGSLALLGAFVVLFALGAEGFQTIALGIWGVLVLVALLGVVAFSKRIRRAIRLEALLNKLPPGLAGVLKKVDQAVYFYRGHKLGIGGWLLLGMANHAASVSSVMLIGEALGVGMPPFEYFVLVPVINIASAFPIGPNGWGVGEALFRLLFGQFGAGHLAASAGVARSTAEVIMGTRGVALSVLFRIHMTLWSLLGGLLVLFEKDRVTREEIDEEVAREAIEAHEAQGAPDVREGGAPASS